MCWGSILLEYDVGIVGEDGDEVLGEDTDVFVCIDLALHANKGPDTVRGDKTPHHDPATSLLLLRLDIPGMKCILGAPTAPRKAVRAPKVDLAFIGEPN